MNAAIGRRKAFLIGNQIFGADSGLAPLKGPVNDVCALEALLRHPTIGCFDELEAFVDQTRDQILPRLEEAMGDARPDDLIFLYYAGHGVLDRQGKLCLATRDTKNTARSATSIPSHHLREIISHSRCKTVVLFLDCCFSGGIDSGLRGADVESQFAMLQQTNGLFILTASTAIETAGETEDENGGLTMGKFTAAVVAGISSGQADADKDGRIGLSELADWVQRNVRGQTPRFWAMDTHGDPTIAFTSDLSVLPDPRPAISSLGRANRAKRIIRAIATRPFLLRAISGTLLVAVLLAGANQLGVFPFSPRLVSQTVGPITLDAGGTYNLPLSLKHAGPVTVSVKTLNVRALDSEETAPNSTGIWIAICSARMGGDCPHAQLAQSEAYSADLPKGAGHISVFNFASNPRVSATLGVDHPE